MVDGNGDGERSERKHDDAEILAARLARQTKISEEEALKLIRLIGTLGLACSRSSVSQREALRQRMSGIPRRTTRAAGPSERSAKAISAAGWPPIFLRVRHAPAMVTC